MARTNEAAVFDASLSQIRLFVRASALEGINCAALPRQYETMAVNQHADECAIGKAINGCNGHEAGRSGLHSHYPTQFR